MNSLEAKCTFCEKNKSKYTCPKCSLPYCSVLCYRSEKHGSCSQGFYRDRIEEYVQHDPTVDPETRRMTMEMIDKSRQGEKEEETAQAIGGINLENESDSEEEQDFETRFKGINFDVDELDDETVHEIMKRLTDDEKEEFESLIQSGKIMDLLPIDEVVKLKPPPLIEEVDKDEEDEDSLCLKGACGGATSHSIRSANSVKGHN